MTNDVSTQVLQAFLNAIWTRARDGANTLRDQLVTEQAAAVTLVEKGTLASVGKNSSNQSYTNYGPGHLTHVQIVELLGNLLNLYDDLKEKITCEFSNSAEFAYTVPDAFDFDQPIYDLLNKIFRADPLLLPNITALRLPPTVFPRGALTW